MTEAQTTRNAATFAARYFYTYKNWPNHNRKVAEALGRGLFVLTNRAKMLERKEAER